jgi:hypothetical protein
MIREIFDGEIEQSQRRVVSGRHWAWQNQGLSKMPGFIED